MPVYIRPTGKPALQLPDVPDAYSREHLLLLGEAIVRADRMNRKRGEDVDMEYNTANALQANKLILVSPDGTRYQVVVSNIGALTAEAV